MSLNGSLVPSQARANRVSGDNVRFSWAWKCNPAKILASQSELKSCTICMNVFVKTHHAKQFQWNLPPRFFIMLPFKSHTSISLNNTAVCFTGNKVMFYANTRYKNIFSLLEIHFILKCFQTTFETITSTIMKPCQCTSRPKEFEHCHQTVLV